MIRVEDIIKYLHQICFVVNVYSTCNTILRVYNINYHNLKMDRMELYKVIAKPYALISTINIFVYILAYDHNKKSNLVFKQILIIVVF